MSTKQEYLGDLFFFQNVSKKQFPNKVKFGPFSHTCHIIIVVCHHDSMVDEPHAG